VRTNVENYSTVWIMNVSKNVMVMPVSHVRFWYSRNVTVRKKRDKWNVETRNSYVVKLVVSYWIVESIHVTKSVMKDLANHVRNHQVRSNTVLATEEQSRNWLERIDSNVLILSLFVVTLVRNSYHVESTSVQRSVTMMSAKDVKFWSSNSVLVEKIRGYSHVIKFTILITWSKG
jgi:hypothetical protein